MTTIFGIKNCDTIKKAKKWLEQQGIEYQFHDYRIDGINQEFLQKATRELGWENVLNKRGTTFRQLSEEQKQHLDEAKAIQLMLEAPAMVKRPILDLDGQLHLGFKPDQYKGIFNAE